MSRGFTLLEVLLALAILGLALVTLMQLSAQGLRLLRLSGDYQQAVLVADHIARSTDARNEGVETGQEGAFRWERRVSFVSVADDLTPPSGPRPKLLALSVAVRWGRDRVLEVASLRALADTQEP